MIYDEPPGGSFVICPICRWEDCNLQFADPYYDGGPNGLSLADHQENVIERLPLSVQELGGYRRDPNWRPFGAKQ